MAKEAAAQAADREIDRTDNNPPEALPQQLASVTEIDTIVRADVDRLTTAAVLELDTCSRVPSSIQGDNADEIYQRVTSLAARVKTLADEIDERRGVHKRPYLDVTQKLDERFKLVVPGVDGGKDRVLRKELDGAHKNLKGLLSDYDTRKYQEEEAARLAEQQRLAEQAAADGIQMSDAPSAPVLAATVKSAHGGQSVRSLTTEWEVVDEALLPRSVLSVDPKKVEALIAGGATEIPGIRMNKRVNTHVKKR